MPVRWLIGPGLLLVGAGLLLMRGLHAGSSWTHLILGFAVAGVGSGLVNPPLASTAVGVVAPKDAGMASGINATFRQVGIATAIAALGTIFANHLHQVSPSTLGIRYATAINELLLIAALTAITTGILALILIRTKDFATHPSSTKEGSDHPTERPHQADPDDCIHVCEMNASKHRVHLAITPAGRRARSLASWSADAMSDSARLEHL